MFRLSFILLIPLIWVGLLQAQDSSGVRVAYTMFDFWHEAENICSDGEYGYVAGR